MKKMSFVYIIFAGMLWGTAGIFSRYLTEFGMSALQNTAVRGFLAALSMCLFVLFYNKKLFKTEPKQLIYMIFAGITMYGTSIFYFIAIEHSSVSTAAVLMYTAPVFVMIYSVCFLGERMTKLKLLSVVFMLVGCALVSGIAGGLVFSLKGILFGLLSGLSYSTYNIITKVEMKKRFEPVTSSLYCFMFMAITSVIPGDISGVVTIVSNKPVLIPVMVLFGLVSCFLPYYLYTLALKNIPAGTASSLAIIEPLAATLYSVVLLGERLSLYSIIGIFLIVSAVYMLSKTEEK